METLTEDIEAERQEDGDIDASGDDYCSPVPPGITELPFKDVSLSIGTAAEHEYQFSGITLIPDTRDIVVCDHGNRTVVLVDEDYNIKSKHSSVFQPWGVTAVSATLIVVAFPVVRLLQYFKIKAASRVLPWRPVVSGCEYFGLAYDREVILATCKFDGTEYIPCVHFIGRDGKIKHKICWDANGDLIFSDPNFIAVNTDNHVVFVSDQGTRSILSFTGNGHMLSVFSSVQVDPRGVGIDMQNGTVLVGDQQTGSVWQLTPSLRGMKRLVAKDDVTQCPSAVTHCFRTDRLIVSTEHSSRLRVFQKP